MQKTFESKGKPIDWLWKSLFEESPKRCNERKNFGNKKRKIILNKNGEEFRECENKERWSKFRESGLLLFVNSFLHIFGWAIVVELDEDDSIISAYPKRIRYRGFHEKAQSRAYAKISKYMVENAENLQSEATDE